MRNFKDFNPNIGCTKHTRGFSIIRKIFEEFLISTYFILSQFESERPNATLEFSIRFSLSFS